MPAYEGILYRGLYPQTDLRYYSAGSELKYEFLLHPDADVRHIALEYAGAQALQVNSKADLEIATAWGTLIEQAPVAWQESPDGSRQPVAVRFDLLGGTTVGFQVGRYDPTLPLVIDPGLDYGTFVGGAARDAAFALAMDDSGNVIVTGETLSGNFPTTTGAFDAGQNGGKDVFVYTLSADASSLLHSTYVGGSGNEVARRVRLDGAGNAVLTGRTESPDFPTTAGAYDSTHDGSGDVFLVKVAADGSSLLYSTLVGGSGDEGGWGLVLDSGGSALVSGFTTSSSFPTSAGAYDTVQNGAYDVFVLKMGDNGTSLVYSTLVGGLANDYGWNLAVDGAGNPVITGQTESPNFPTTSGAYDQVHNGNQDAFVFKLAQDGSSLLYSTYVGGSSHGEGFGLALDGAGNVVVAGRTMSSDFPTTPGAFDPSLNGSGNAFVFKLAADGSSLLYGTYIGGNSRDAAFALALDCAGNAFVTGETASGSFPTTAGAFDTGYNGSWDAFVLKLAANGDALLYSTFVGGSGADEGRGLLLDDGGNSVVAGYADSQSFPTTVGAYDTSLNGGRDTFVLRLPFDPPICLPELTTDLAAVHVEEGLVATNTGTVSDPNDDVVTLSASVGQVINNGDGTWSWSWPTSDGPSDSQTVTITADDGNGGVATATFDLTVSNVAPKVLSLSLPADPISIYDQSLFSIDLSFSDPAGAHDDDYTCGFDVDANGSVDVVKDDITYGAAGGSCGTMLGYAEPGVYTVKVTVTDKDGGSDGVTATEYIVIYDPDGDFVTGGGWISSPAGACRFGACSDDTTGKASFGFVSKYKKGADTPTGQTEFQFKAGDLNFHSSSYDWLVVAGAKAKYKGVGTINGAGNYGFMLSAVDEKLTPSTEVDLFRIKIWDRENGDMVVYDNEMGGEDNAEPATEIGGGSIVVHRAK